MAAMLRLVGADDDVVGAEAADMVGASDAEVVVLSEDEFVALLRRAALDGLPEAA